ncbi:ATP-binding protein [Prauserella muralis]
MTSPTIRCFGWPRRCSPTSVPELLRNGLLADAFKRTGIVERTGRGINRMFAEQLRVGRPAPDYGRTTDQQVAAIVPGGPRTSP